MALAATLGDYMSSAVGAGVLVSSLSPLGGRLAFASSLDVRMTFEVPLGNHVSTTATAASLCPPRAPGRPHGLRGNPGRLPTLYGSGGRPLEVDADVWRPLGLFGCQSSLTGRFGSS
mmetsp:Transcript_46668/g.91164  ORF Transcript_46668/g.91164 Transcript_46668/m.91164 type:complete len:117 (+) Transcript_46668:855-1205(+)